MKTLLFACACLFGLSFAALAAPDATASYQAENVVELLTNYGKMTGKKILLDSTVQGKIGFVASADENVDRKVELIEKTLFLNGFTLIDVGDDVIAVMGPGKPVRSLALPLYTKPGGVAGRGSGCSRTRSSWSTETRRKSRESSRNTYRRATAPRSRQIGGRARLA